MSAVTLNGQRAFLFDEEERQVEAVDETAPLPAACQPDAPFEDKVELAKESIIRQFREGRHLVVGTSFGKDSSVCNALVCSAMFDARQQGIEIPTVVFAHSMTGYDNPAIDQYAIGEIEVLRDYLRKHDLPAKVEVQEPTLSNDYMVNMVGGRMLATMPGTGRACADMLKVQTSRQLKRRLKSALPGDVVNVVGKRWDESAARASNMSASGERPDVPVEVSREKLLCPIAHFTLDDIWMMVGMAKLARESDTAAAYETYTDFEAMTQAYRDGNGGDCMVNAFAHGKASSAGCGQRFGCWVCSQVENDQSMENMVAETHPHFRSLLNIRQYIVDNHWDPSNRRWLTREPNSHGELTIEPNAYSPEFCRNLLRFIITAQADEEERAMFEGTEPAFEIFNERKLMAVQALWARYGYGEPWAALSDWHDIYSNGKRYYPEPREAPALRENFPRVEKARLPLTVFTGNDASQLKSVAQGFASECLPWEGEGKDPRPEIDPSVPLNSDGIFDVDAEGAEMFVGIVGQDILDKVRAQDPLTRLKQTEPEAYEVFATANPLLMRRMEAEIRENYSVVGTRPSDVVRTMLNYGFLEVRDADRGTWEQMLTVADSLSWHQVTDIIDNPEALHQLARSVKRYGGERLPEHLNEAEATRLKLHAEAEGRVVPFRNAPPHAGNDTPSLPGM